MISVVLLLLGGKSLKNHLSNQMNNPKKNINAFQQQLVQRKKITLKKNTSHENLFSLRKIQNYFSNLLFI